ncbi:MAG: hypothetical protein HFJ65_08510 [Eggerthellaceae bacterium]|nr:hypothetical protein [Eggerthellaceae bacterium]
MRGPKAYGVTPAGRISRKTQREHVPIEGFHRVEGRIEDRGFRRRPPKRLYGLDGELYPSVRAISRAIGCDEKAFKRAVRNGKQWIKGRSFTVWEKDPEYSN